MSLGEMLEFLSGKQERVPSSQVPRHLYDWDIHLELSARQAHFLLVLLDLYSPEAWEGSLCSVLWSKLHNFHQIEKGTILVSPNTLHLFIQLCENVGNAQYWDGTIPDLEQSTEIAQDLVIKCILAGGDRLQDRG